MSPRDLSRPPSAPTQRASWGVKLVKQQARQVRLRQTLAAGMRASRRPLPGQQSPNSAKQPNSHQHNKLLVSWIASRRWKMRWSKTTWCTWCRLGGSQAGGATLRKIRKKKNSSRTLTEISIPSASAQWGRLNLFKIKRQRISRCFTKRPTNQLSEQQKVVLVRPLMGVHSNKII